MSNWSVIILLTQRQMQEENLKKQEDSVQKQEDMRRGRYELNLCYHLHLSLPL